MAEEASVKAGEKEERPLFLFPPCNNEGNFEPMDVCWFSMEVVLLLRLDNGEKRASHFSICETKHRSGGEKFPKNSDFPIKIEKRPSFPFRESSFTAAGKGHRVSGGGIFSYFLSQ